MKKIDLGQSISILANIGVIAGIVFLGIELQQNNELLAAESRATSLANRMNLREKALDPQIAEVIVRAWESEELTPVWVFPSADLSPVERLQLFTLHQMQMEQWEWAYEEAELGEGRRPEPSTIRGLFAAYPGISEYWHEHKEDHPSGFRQWIDEALAGE